MKLKALMAASSLALVAAHAQAALYNVDLSFTGVFFGAPTEEYSNTGTGTAIYDSVENTLTGSFSEHVAIKTTGNLRQEGNLTRTFVFDFDTPVGQYVTLTCSQVDGDGQICGSGTNTIGLTLSFGDIYTTLSDPANVPFSLDTALGATTSFFTVGGPAYREFTITMGAEVSEVPVPAAAWLFGSSLLGLASAARKRKA